MTDGIETYRGTVYPWEEDHNAHINVAHYVAKFDEATWQFLSMLGLTRSYLRQANRGMVAVQQNISYRRELVAGDVVHVKTVLAELSARKVRYTHHMVHSITGDAIADMELVGVHIDLDKRRSCPFPDTVRDAADRIEGAHE